MGCSNSLETRAQVHVQEPNDGTLKGTEFEVVLTKKEGKPLGACIKKDKDVDEVIVVSLSEGGAFRAWNDEHPTHAVRPGDRVLAVNGVTGENFDNLTEQLWKTGEIRVLVLRKPGSVALTRTKSREFLDEFCRQITPMQCPVDHLLHANAGECGSTECAICFEEYEHLDDRVVLLPCKHAFHPLCAARWFNEKKTTCPLCVQAVPALVQLWSVRD
jgi:hypothetical protein